MKERLDQAVARASWDRAKSDRVRKAYLALPRDIHWLVPILPIQQTVDYLMQQAVTTDRNNGIILTRDNLAVHDFIGMMCMLRLRQRVINVRLIEHVPHTLPILSRGTCAAEWI